MKKLFITLSIATLASCADKAPTQEQGELLGMSQKVIYGEDGRRDLYEITDPNLLTLADSTVALIEEQQIPLTSESTVNLIGNTFGDDYNLCQDEPFREQKSVAFCSGFLVAPNKIATAGHCVKNNTQCQKIKFVFGFGVMSKNSDGSLIQSSEVYSCKRLIHKEVDNTGADYAIVELDRNVSNHQPLKLRKNGLVSPGTLLNVIGHPAGLPTKIDIGGKVRSNENNFFRASLDTYGGNSGSAVFNAVTGEVEGILVRGEEDFAYDYSNQCTRSNVCPEDGCRGEDVSDITLLHKHL